MRQWIGSALVQIMACHLFGAKPLSKPFLGYCQLYPKEQTSVKFLLKYETFHSRKYIWKYRLRNGGHFVWGRWVNRMIGNQCMNSRLAIITGSVSVKYESNSRDLTNTITKLKTFQVDELTKDFLVTPTPGQYLYSTCTVPSQRLLQPCCVSTGPCSRSFVECFCEYSYWWTKVVQPSATPTPNCWSFSQYLSVITFPFSLAALFCLSKAESKAQGIIIGKRRTCQQQRNLQGPVSV